MKPNHTPGPWKRHVFGSSIRINPPNGTLPICALPDNGTAEGLARHRSGESQANARLIAAAPELLNALRAALFRLELLDKRLLAGAEPDAELHEISIGRAAIARATGAKD